MEKRLTWADLAYNILLALLSLFYLPLLALRRKNLRLYVAGFSREELAVLRGRRVVWVQAVSVGEVAAVLPLLKAWREERPGWAVVLTTTTEGGQAAAKKLAASYADLIGYFPLDLAPVVRRVLGQVRPDVFLMAELEIWPNFIRAAKRRGTWIAIVNGRISDRSFPRYRLIRPLLAAVWHRIDRICAQTALDAERFLALGADAACVVVTGNIKFDIAYAAISSAEVAEFKRSLGWERGQKILTAASTHPGEEEEIVRVFAALRQRYACRLLLAPRHPDRREEVVKLLKENRLTFRLRSQTERTDADPEVLLLDTFGELPLAYAAGDAVFVGGSLVPVGGHNILEAAAQKRPVVYGPYMHNFTEIESLFRREGVGFTVNNGAELQAIVADFWDKPAYFAELGARAYELIRRHRGATRTTLRLLPGGEEKHSV